MTELSERGFRPRLVISRGCCVRRGLRHCDSGGLVCAGGFEHGGSAVEVSFSATDIAGIGTGFLGFTVCVVVVFVWGAEFLESLTSSCCACEDRPPCATGYE